MSAPCQAPKSATRRCCFLRQASSADFADQNGLQMPRSRSEDQGGLRLTSREDIVKGGDSGPAVVLEKLDTSRLLQAIRYQDGPEMPPKEKAGRQRYSCADPLGNGENSVGNHHRPKRRRPLLRAIAGKVTLGRPCLLGLSARAPAADSGSKAQLLGAQSHRCVRAGPIGSEGTDACWPCRPHCLAPP